MANKQHFDDFIIMYMDNAHRLAGIYIENQEDIEDVVADSIEKAFRNIKTLKEPDAIVGWFNKIIINTAIDHLRKSAKGNFFGKKEMLYYFDEFSSIEFDSLLEILPPNDKKIVSLRFKENYGLKEISELLGMNENTVKTRLYRSLKKLKLEITRDTDALAVKPHTNRKGTKNIAVWSTSVLLSVVLLFNIAPPLAVAAYDIPVIGNIIKVITFNRFAYSHKGYDAEVNLPEIQGLMDKELEGKLRAEFSSYADNLIRSFEETVIEIENLGLEQLDDNPVHMSIKADYIVKADNDDVLSLDAFLYSDVNGYVVHKFVTIDKRKEAVVTLKTLFKPDADYITPISTYLVAEMIRLNEEEGGSYDVGESMFEVFSEIKPDQHFYIDNDGKLVICFDKYEVASGNHGSPEFVIPTDVIQDIVLSDLIS